MKINKKLIVSSLASAMGLSIVGAITGTVAWYQYSTRSTFAMVGVSAKTAANLQIKVGDGAYKTDLSVADINTYLTSQSKNANLSPITSGEQAKDAALTGLKAHPLYKVFDDQYWGAAAAEAYVQFPLTLKWSGQVEGVAQDASGKKIWLNDLLIEEKATTGKGDLSSAVRVHLAATNNMLLSNAGEDLNVYGNLDLNRDGVLDSSSVTWNDFQTGSATAYGADGKVQEAYDIAHVQPTIGNDGNPADGIELGETNASGELAVTVTIWLEGWQTLENHVAVKPAADTDVSTGYYTDADCTIAATGTANGSTTYYQKVQSADWDENLYIGAQFNLGLEFVTERL